jgi:predicted NBD/HSP70 family sugar kinase
MIIQKEMKAREDAVLRFLRVVHQNGLYLRENGRKPGELGVDPPSSARRLTQVDAAQRAGLSRPSVASYAARMRGVVLDRDNLAVKSDSGYAIGVDISETHGARVALSDISGHILKTLSADDRYGETELRRQSAGEALGFVEGAIRDLLEEWELSSNEIIGVGISLVGPVKSHYRIGRNAGIWRSLSAADELARRLGWEDVPFETQSDSYLSALAENMWGGGHIDDHTLFVKWAAQLRAAIVIHGELYVGHSGSAGELPHQKVEGLERVDQRFKEDGLMDPCPVCNQQECLHMIAPLEAISKAFTGKANERASLLIEQAERERGALELLKVAAKGIGRAVAPLVEALDPQTVIIGGALGSRAFPIVFESLTQAISEAGGRAREESVTVKGGRLQELTAVRGAVALALLEFAPAYLRARAEAEATLA